jgi:hypothetical protein
LPSTLTTWCVSSTLRPPEPMVLCSEGVQRVRGMIRARGSSLDDCGFTRRATAQTSCLGYYVDFLPPVPLKTPDFGGRRRLGSNLLRAGVCGSNEWLGGRHDAEQKRCLDSQKWCVRAPCAFRHQSLQRHRKVRNVPLRAPRTTGIRAASRSPVVCRRASGERRARPRRLTRTPEPNARESPYTHNEKHESEEVLRRRTFLRDAP